MKKILVTGGSGFIGNCFCKLLLAERPDYKVLNVDVETYAANHNTIIEELKNPKYKFYQYTQNTPKELLLQHILQLKELM